MHGINIKVIKITIYVIELETSRNAKEDVDFNFEWESRSLTLNWQTRDNSSTFLSLGVVCLLVSAYSNVWTKATHLLSESQLQNYENFKPNSVAQSIAEIKRFSFAVAVPCIINALVTELTVVRNRKLREITKEEDKEVDVGEEEEVKNKNRIHRKVENKTTGCLYRPHRLQTSNDETTLTSKTQTAS